MSFALHREIIKSSQVSSVITGNFVHGNIFKSQNVKEFLSHQLLTVKGNYFEVFSLFSLDNQDDYKYSLVAEYPVNGEIISVEKIKINQKDKYDSVVLVFDYAKIAFVKWDPNNNDFQILCLYNLENEYLSNGKKFYKDDLQLVSSRNYRSVFILSHDTNVTILQQRSLEEENVDMLSEEEQLKYIDTVYGEEYFEPSFNLNFREFSVSKIIKFYIANKENEIIDYTNTEIGEGGDMMTMAILYKDSGLVETGSESTVTPNFLRTKVNLGIFNISKSTKQVQMVEQFENLDHNSFDLIYYSKTNEVFVFSPYSIQYINFEQKIYKSIILNPLYVGVFTTEFMLSNSSLLRGDMTYGSLSLDLRGGGYLSISSLQFIFTSSKGVLFAFTLNTNMTSFSIGQIHLENTKNEYYTLDTPYKFITMPHLGVFYLASYFSDGVFLKYSMNNYVIFKHMINISPVTNFQPLLDRLHTKFIMCSGYDKKGSLNFLYDKLFFEIVFTSNEFQEISQLKALHFKGDVYSKYLVVILKNGKNCIFEVGKNLENVTDKINFQHDKKIIASGLIKIKNFNSRNYNQYIVIVYQKFIQVFDPVFQLISEVYLKDLIHTEKEDVIKFAKLCENFILISTSNEKFVISRFNDKQSQNNYNTFSLNTESNIYKSIKINDYTDFEYREITKEINSDDSKNILKFDINTKLIAGKHLMVIHRSEGVLEIWEMSFDSKLELIFVNSLINELPVMLSDMRIEEFKNDYDKSSSDLSTNITINTKSPLNIGLGVPEQIFFDILETKIIFSIIYKNGTIVYYEVFLIFRENSFYSLKMKKFYVEYIENIDFRDFFYNEESNIYNKFENINEKSGVLLNIKNNQKILFEVNGRLKFLDLENNIYLKRSISAFSELSKEGSLNGFIYYENGILKVCTIPYNYEITEVGLIKRTPLYRFPVNMNIVKIPRSMHMFYYYILVEKEFKPTAINIKGVSITVNKFIYFLTLRAEDPKPLDQIEFPPNEIIVESKIVELVDLLKKKTQYIAIGVNIISDNGEESACKGKLLLFNIEGSKFVQVLESELRGVISMIHSIDGILIVSEGSRIFLYQYAPLTNEIKKLAVIDNKNLVACSKVHTNFIITGDIFNSASWIVFKNHYDANNSSIYILGNDDSDYRSTAIDFWIDDTEENLKRGCFLADDQKNLHLFLINVDSNQKVVFKEVADIHLSKKITELSYLLYNNKSVVYYSAGDGSIGYIKPVSKTTHDRLSLLCEYLYNRLPFRGGLNPKQFFSTATKSQSKKEIGNILDWELINSFMLMPLTTQKIVANNVPSTRETLIQNINELILK